MKKYSFFLSAMILALGGFFAKGIGALYKIPLTNILGSSGMGLYYLIFPVYSLLIICSSSGISFALATEVAKCRKIRHRYNEQKMLRVSLIFGFLISLIFSVILIFLSKPLSELQGNVNAYMGYIVISPAIIISTIIAILRGYFQGVENMVPTTVSMIVEQIVKLSVGLILAHKLCNYGIQYAVLGAVVGVTFSEVVALILIAINFITYKGQMYYNYKNKFYKKKEKQSRYSVLKSKCLYSKAIKKWSNQVLRVNNIRHRYTNKVALDKLLKISAPATLSSIIIPLVGMLDSFLIINILTEVGFSTYTSTSMYGLWSGLVQTLISLPTVLIVAISTAIIPSLSGLIVKNDTNELRQKISFYIKLTWILALIMFVVVYVYAEDILIFLYGDGLSSTIIDELSYATKMLKISSVSIIYHAFLQTFTAILQTIGLAKVPFFALSIAGVVRFILLEVLTRNLEINIFGPIFANIIFLALAIIIMMVAIKAKIKFEYNLLNHFVIPIALCFLCLILGTISHHLLKNVCNYFVSMIITAIIIVAVYLLGIYFGKTLSPKEKNLLRLKSKIVKRK